MAVTTFDQVLQAARSLSRNERALLIARLADDLAVPILAPSLSDEVQREAIQSALDDYQANPDTIIAHEQVLGRIQTLLNAHKPCNPIS